MSGRFRASTADWESIRDKVVEQAIQDEDYEALRRISALPGGFGSEVTRRKVWPFLLQTQLLCDSNDLDDAQPAEVPNIHRDEHQVSLDTNRSFVSYPTGIPQSRKRQMQYDLQDLIVGVLRKYPSLSYFQGYHDILSVLYLTFIPQTEDDPPTSRTHSRSSSRNKRNRENTFVQFNDNDEMIITDVESTPPRDSEEWQILRQCAEVVSLCRVRDAMGSTMEPMMGMLKILKRILKASDPELSTFSSSISPIPTLPFFALSWILCLFSHDIDTLEPIQRMFDYLLARNPISALYLAVAILILKKPQMFDLAKHLGPEAISDPSLLHPLFSRLPPLYPDTPSNPSPIQPKPPEKPNIDLGTHPDDLHNPYSPLLLSKVFELSDQLMQKYPWDGKVIGGKSIMGPDSIVCTYDREMNIHATQNEPAEEGEKSNDWTLGIAEKLVNGEVVLPGAMEPDEEDEVPFRQIRRSRFNLRIPRSKTGTVIAVSVILIGIGVAYYGRRNDGAWVNIFAIQQSLLREYMKVFENVRSVVDRYVRNVLNAV